GASSEVTQYNPKDAREEAILSERVEVVKLGEHPSSVFRQIIKWMCTDEGSAFSFYSLEQIILLLEYDRALNRTHSSSNRRITDALNSLDLRAPMLYPSSPSSTNRKTATYVPHDPVLDSAYPELSKRYRLRSSSVSSPSYDLPEFDSYACCILH
ncbi:hypothetical protein V5O48_016421, partial [Marasmius crinis-equi]